MKKEGHSYQIKRKINFGNFDFAIRFAWRITFILQIYVLKHKQKQQLL